ncbi:MAG: amidohydrolase [Clostridia bacterium]|nr:amidohydrolase [Clostridia bacterium]
MIKIEKDILDLKQHIVEVRRALHQIPESGLQENETTDLILKYLTKLGLKVERGVSGTGAIAFFEGAEGKKTIAYRADIDALSVDEMTGVDYCSTKPGYMHACGHDGHTAILLGFAHYAVKHQKDMKNNLLFIFQPAEEGPGGAEAIVDAGILEKFEVSAHGAMPHKGSDALLAAAATVTALNTVIGRNIDPLEPAVLNIGRFESGERRNIIAGEAVLEGTVRAFNEETYSILRNRLIDTVKYLPESFGCTADLEIRDMYPAVTNDPELFEIFRAAVGEENLEVIKPMTISEDFSYFQKRVPGLFFMLGSRNAEKGYINPLHSNKFNFNEDILLSGIQLFNNIRKQFE